MDFNLYLRNQTLNLCQVIRICPKICWNCDQTFIKLCCIPATNCTDTSCMNKTLILLVVLSLHWRSLLPCWHISTLIPSIRSKAWLNMGIWGHVPLVGATIIWKIFGTLSQVINPFLFSIITMWLHTNCIHTCSANWLLLLCQSQYCILMALSQKKRSFRCLEFIQNFVGLLWNLS